MNSASMDPLHTLPVLSEQYDTLRLGLPALKAQAQPAGEAEANLQQLAAMHADMQKLVMERLYGTTFTAQRSIERQILSRCQRLPGIPSSMIGLESLTGELDDFGFGDYLGCPMNDEVGDRMDMHSIMEARLGLSQQGPARPRTYM
eukprot:TRINITY_DN23556_c0_g1_i1.p1 TRINITY_DN23556_c0_g1~~TRINITY_DN23556_c0_g1_i1.p1  ORF type:complete len:146 (-),score=29.87 TRINITY_DN23556_c0_g1_i1:496-933(-)